ncbi:MAG: hypothetical protein PHU12_04260 [Candidatus Aenigmarchaeota archaeon]|nr:hypothetical protein [Candidatus Aenigmarchaeota archaeon]
MENISIKVDIAPEFKKEFELALAKVTRELVNKLELAIAEEIISKSEFKESDADELSDKVKESMYNDLVKRGLI